MTLLSELRLDDFDFTHLQKSMVIPDGNIILTNVLVIQDSRKFTIATLTNKVITTIPFQQFQKTVYLNNTLFGLTKDALYYFKEEWIKYQIGEILDFCTGTHIYLLTSSDLLSIDVSDLPPVSHKLQIPMLNHLELFKSLPTSNVVLIYSQDIIYICTKDKYTTISYQNVQDIIIHPNGLKLAIIQNNIALVYSCADFINNKLNLLAKITLLPYRHLIWVDSFLADIQITPADFTNFRIFGNSSHLDIQLPPLIAFNNTVDGFKCLSSNFIHFIYPIPMSLSNCTNSKSTHPTQLLCQSYQQWSNRIPTLDFLNLPLDACVSNILEASLHAFDVQTQKRLLRIARFAISFTRGIATDATCKILRVLNALRDHYDPFFTYTQYVTNNNQLLNWLINANEHYLAFQIAKHLGFKNSESILIQWSKTYLMRVKYDFVADEVVGELILKQCRSLVNDLKSISFTQMAQFALLHGRVNTAIMLVDHDSIPNHQIPLLLKLNKDDAAMGLAIQCCSGDLIELVLMHLINNKVPYSVIYNMLMDKPYALHVFSQLEKDRWIECCFQLALKQEHCHALLKNCVHANSQVVINVNSTSRVVDPSSLLQHKQYLQQAITIATEAKWTNDAKILNSELKLLNTQELLENEIWSSTQDSACKFIGYSLSNTIVKCITYGLHAKAFKLKSEFKMPDKRFWWIYIKAVASIRDWENLEKWSQRKSPIGFDPFVKVCLDQGAYKEALKYIPKCVDPTHQINYYIKIKAYNKGAEVAHLQRKGDLLKEILDKMNSEDASKYLYEQDDLNDYTKQQMKTMWMQDVERKLADIGIIVIK